MCLCSYCLYVCACLNIRAHKQWNEIELPFFFTIFCRLYMLPSNDAMMFLSALVQKINAFERGKILRLKITPNLFTIYQIFE